MFTFGGFGGNAVGTAAPPALPLPRSQQPAAPFSAVLGAPPPASGGIGGGGVLPSPGNFSGVFSNHQPPRQQQQQHHHQPPPPPQHFSLRGGDTHAPHGALPTPEGAMPMRQVPVFGNAAPHATAGAIPLSAVPIFGGPPPSAAPVLSQSGGRVAGGGVLGGTGGPLAVEPGILSSVTGPHASPPRNQRAATGSGGGGTAAGSGSAAGSVNSPRPLFASPQPAGGGCGGGEKEAKPWLGTTTPSHAATAASPTPPPSVAAAGPPVFGAGQESSGSGSGSSGVGPAAAAPAAAGSFGVLGSAFGGRSPAASGTGANYSTQPPPASSALPASSLTSSVFGATPAVSSTSAAAAAPPLPPQASTMFATAVLPSSSAHASPSAAAFGKPDLRSSNATVNSNNSSLTTSGVFGSVLDATVSAAPVSSAFDPPPPKPTTTLAPPSAQAATNIRTSSTSTNSSNPFKPAFPLAAAAPAVPVANTSAFGLGATPAKPTTAATTTTTSTTAGPASSAFASAARPPPTASSAFSASVPPTRGPPTASSAFAAASPGESATTAGRRRGRSPPPPQKRHDNRAPPAQTTRVEPAAPTHTKQQPQRQQQQSPKAPHRQQPARPLRTIDPLERLPVPSLPSDEKKLCLAARLCKSFLLQLASASALGGAAADHSRDEDAVRALEQAYFGVVGTEGVHGDFGKTAGEMLALWQGQVRPMLPGTAAAAFPAELWIALFGLGTYLNTITATVTAAAHGGGSCRSPAPPAAAGSSPSAGTGLATYKAGLRAHPVAALSDACHYANEVSELLQALFQRGDDTNAPPYSIIPVVLRRVRSVFDEATARGVATVQSNLNAVTSKLFAVLNRRVKTSAVQPLNSPGEPARWLLTVDSKEKESLVHAFAYLIIEMIAADAPMNDDVELFVAAFHDCFPAALAERCMLYYRRACALLRHSLSMPVVEQAASLLAKALAVYPPGAPPHNRRVLEVKLLATEVALGRLPRDDGEWRQLGVPQLVDVVNALKTARLDLLDIALRVHGAFFVEAGVHNVLCLARERLALLMVVKYYLTHGCESRLSVQEMVRYHHLPYSAADAGVVWLLPLLTEKHMNGVLDHDFLILSGKSPFDAYPHPELITAAAALATR